MYIIRYILLKIYLEWSRRKRCTTYKYYTASDIVTISKVNCDVLVGNDSTVGDNMIAFRIQVLSNSSTSSRTWYVEWRWLGSQNNATRGTQQGSPVVGRFAYK